MVVGTVTDEHARRLQMVMYRIWKRVPQERAEAERAQQSMLANFDSPGEDDAIEGASKEGR